MAITDAQKVDYLFKKLGFGVSKTDVNSVKVAANESIASPLLLRADKVWQQSSTIPAVKPGSTSGVVQVYSGSSTVECTADVTASTNRTWKTGLTDWIPPEFGSTYLVNVYVHTSGDAANAASSGTKLFITGSGNNDEWFFDYQSGVLNFIGTNLPNGISFTGKSIYITGARYTGTFGVGTLTGEDISLGNLFVSNTTLTTINTNTDLILTANGSGYVIIDASTLQLPSGTSAERPATGEAGMIRWNTSNEYLEYYDGSAWEPIVNSITNITSDTFTGDGSSVAFTLSQGSTTNGTIVSINGVVQKPTSAYTVSGSTLTLTEAPLSTDVIEARVVVAATTINTLSDANTKITVDDAVPEIIATLDGTDIITINSSGVTIDSTLTVGNVTYTDTDGTNGQVLTTYGNGVTYWSSVTSGAHYTDSDVAAYLSGNLSTSIVPDTDQAYDLGSATYQFNDLYLSGNTIYLAGNTLSVGAGNAILWNSAAIGVTSYNDLNDLPTLVTSYNNLTDLPTLPTDISDLTDSGNLLSSGGISLTDISLTTGSKSGSGVLSYNNSTGAFTFNPAQLGSYSFSSANNTIQTSSGSSPIILSINGATSDDPPALISKKWSFAADGSFNFLDPFLETADATITTTKVGQWDNAYSWGNHASAGYLTSETYTGTLSNVVEDTTPQLGGNLDLNSNNITGTGNINITGNITATGNVDATVNGFEIGYRTIPQVSFTVDATLALTDSGKHYYSTSASSITLTIPTNSSVAFDIGASINIINLGTADITVSPDSGVILYFAGTPTTGSRSISAYGAGTLQKVATDTWFLVGVGVS